MSDVEVEIGGRLPVCSLTVVAGLVRAETKLFERINPLFAVRVVASSPAFVTMAR